MYRIRKEWNGGKWARDQIGAYSVLQTAIANCTDEDVMSGYRVFDENGKIVYPEVLDATAKDMIADGVSVDGEYWTSVFRGETTANGDYVKAVIQRYHSMLTQSNYSGFTVEKCGDINLYKLDLTKFKILYTDSPKSTPHSNCSMIFNLGYFANFEEDGVTFTLPVANLVADIDFEGMPAIAAKYIRERPHTDEKIAFSTYNNAGSQFKGKCVSTLTVKDGIAQISELSGVDVETADYAVSGAPVIIDGKFAGSAYKDQGWDNSIVRATYHGFLGVKSGNLYYFYLKTESSNCITSGEVYDTIKYFEFEDVIKVDGGGSFIFNYADNANVVSESTTGDRQINNIGGIFK